MIIGYKGLKYLELSISSPIQNCSGVITALLLLAIFKEPLATLDIIGIIIIAIGIIILSIVEHKEEKKVKKVYRDGLSGGFKNPADSLVGRIIIWALVILMVAGVIVGLVASLIHLAQ